MKLITGLPRTASSFLCQWFKTEGPQMIPKCYSDHLPTDYTQQKNLKKQLCEPLWLTHEMTFNRNFVHDNIINEINNIEEYNKQFSEGKEQVLKLAPMVFYKYCLHRFDTVIICMRDKESWLKSAKNHGTFNWIYKCKPNWIPDNHYFRIINSINPELLFYEYWSNESRETYFYCEKKDINCLVYNYADDESFAGLHKYFGLPIKKHEDYSYWLSRRF
jgi:hypothetical protein